MNAAVLVKQVVGPSGELVMDELSGMAVAQGVELCAAVGDGLCTAITVGPESAVEVLRTAIAWGGTCSVMTSGLLLNDPAFEGADSLATARALSGVLTQEGPFDLVLLGAESSDGTGLLGPQVAELLDLPFVAAARYLSMQGSWVHVRGRHEDGWLQAVVQLPAVVSCAAGLADPCDPGPAAQALVPNDLIRTVTASDLGPGPWEAAANAPPNSTFSGGPIAAVLEPDTTPELTVWDADTMLAFTGSFVAEDVARAVAEWAHAVRPERLLLPSTVWGREVAGRVAVRLSSDRVAIEIGHLGGLSMAPRREASAPAVQTIAVLPRGRVRVASRTRRTSPTP